MKRSVNKWITDPLKFAHHPLCETFSNHVFIIRGRKLCRGCTMFYPSLVIGTILSLIFGIFQLPTILLAALMTALLLPTMVSLIISLPRPIRDANKAILGLDSGIGVTVVLLHPVIIVKVIVLLVAIPSAVILEKVRKNRDLKTCKICPEYQQRMSLECSGFKVVGNRVKIVDLVSQPMLPDPLQKEPEITRFEEL